MHIDTRDANTAFVIGSAFGAFVVLGMESLVVMGAMTAVRFLKENKKDDEVK